MFFIFYKNKKKLSILKSKWSSKQRAVIFRVIFFAVFFCGVILMQLTLQTPWFSVYLKWLVQQECTSYRNLKFYTRYRIKTYTSNFPWKKCWLMTSIYYWRDPCAFYKPKTVLLKLANFEVISQFILSIGLTGKSFKLISPLDLKILHGLYFFL